MTATVVGQSMYENGLLSKATGGLLRPGSWKLTEQLLKLCDLPINALVLDVGCGSGSTVKYLQEAGFVNVVGVDYSKPLLQTGLHLHLDLPLACSRSDILPVASNQVDAILAECSLSAMSNLDEVLVELNRVLRPDGRLALSDIYTRNPDGLPALGALPLNCGLRGTTSRDDLISHMLAHGFEILVWEDHSETLKYFVAQLILAHGSMNEFWSQSEPTADPMDIQIAISKAKLGYFLLVAKKV